MYLRVLVIGRRQETTDKVTSILEGNGHIVTSTLSDHTAMDMASSSEFDAVIINREVAPTDRGYLATQIRNRDASTVVVTAQSPESVMTQLRQAFKEIGRAY